MSKQNRKQGKQEEDLRSLIVKILSENELSISGLSKVLNKDGPRISRVMLGGFLKGLATTGILSVRSLPPCLVYSCRPIEAAPQDDQPGVEKP